MKHLLACLLLLSSPAAALPALIPASQAHAHLGQNLTVRGAISGVRDTNKATTVFVDGRGRRAHLLVMLNGDAAGLFPDIDLSTGKVIEVSGRIQTVEGRPAIVVTRRTQLFFKD